MSIIPKIPKKNKIIGRIPSRIPKGFIPFIKFFIFFLYIIISESTKLPKKSNVSNRNQIGSEQMKKAR